MGNQRLVVYRRVATVPTVYGIETWAIKGWWYTDVLQQYLPFTVLKLKYVLTASALALPVATVPTVYGIETLFLALYIQQ